MKRGYCAKVVEIVAESYRSVTAGDSGDSWIGIDHDMKNTLKKWNAMPSSDVS